MQCAYQKKVIKMGQEWWWGSCNPAILMLQVCAMTRDQMWVSLMRSLRLQASKLQHQNSLGREEFGSWVGKDRRCFEPEKSKANAFICAYRLIGQKLLSIHCICTYKHSHIYGCVYVHTQHACVSDGGCFLNIIRSLLSSFLGTQFPNYHHPFCLKYSVAWGGWQLFSWDNRKIVDTVFICFRIYPHRSKNEQNKIQIRDFLDPEQKCGIQWYSRLQTLLQRYTIYTDLVSSDNFIQS